GAAGSAEGGGAEEVGLPPRRRPRPHSRARQRQIFRQPRRGQRRLLAVGGLLHFFVDVVEQFARGHGAIVVGVGFALQPAQHVPGEDAVSAAPLRVFLRLFADVAGGHHRALALRRRRRKIFVDQVVGVGR